MISGAITSQYLLEKSRIVFQVSAYKGSLALTPKRATVLEALSHSAAFVQLCDAFGAILMYLTEVPQGSAGFCVVNCKNSFIVNDNVTNIHALNDIQHEIKL